MCNIDSVGKSYMLFEGMMENYDDGIKFSGGSTGRSVCDVISVKMSMSCCRACL